MRPKRSMGYLTPQQTKKNKSTLKSRRTESNEDLHTAKDLSDSFFEKIMSCPIKRQLVLNLINSEKDNIEEYKRNHPKEEKRREINASPLLKIKRNYQCESPTALLRRRALEQQNRPCVLDQRQEKNELDYISGSSSGQSSASSCSTTFNKLLDGVVAYVEIKSKDQDRSNGAKALMISMGAVVRDKFTKDVTHVIFKDGSFTTYQKAKLMKVHLVSVLWIEAVRRNNMRVSEKKFPALGTEMYDHNVSSLCSQLQKDYEEIIRDELHRSLASGTPLPSTQTLIDRRRTIMTPVPSSSTNFSQEFPSSQDIEVEDILQHRRKTYNYMKKSPLVANISPELTSDDDSDLGPFIDGTIVKRKNNLSIPNLLMDKSGLHFFEGSENSNMELTFPNKSTPLINGKKTCKTCNVSGSTMDITTLDHVPICSITLNNVKENCSPNILNESIHCKTTPKLNRSTSKKILRLTNDKIFNVPDDSLYRRKTRQLINDNNISNNTTDTSNEPKLKTTADNSSSTNMSVLELYHNSSLQILSKNVCSNSSNLKNSKDAALDSLSSNSNAIEKSSSTNMSSLQISLSKVKTATDKDNEKAGVSTNTSMSTLLITSDSNKSTTNLVEHTNSGIHNNVLGLDLTKEGCVQGSELSKGKDSFNTNTSFSPINSNVVEQVLQVLDQTPLNDENITKRRKRQSVEKRTYNTRRRTVLPPDINTSESDSTKSDKDLLVQSPSKKVKHSVSVQDTSNESCKKTQKIFGKENSIKRDSDLKQIKLISQLSNSLNHIQVTPKIQNKKIVKSSTNKKSVLENRGSRKNVKQKLTKHNKENSKSSDTSHSESSGTDRKMYKTRKLYNPDESVKEPPVIDEIERNHKRNEIKKRKSVAAVVLNTNIVPVSPNTLLTAKAKEFIDQNAINIINILNKDIGDYENEAKLPKKQKTKKNAKISKDSDADEQQQLAAEFVNKPKDDDLLKKATKQSNRKQHEIIQRRSVRLSQNPKKLNFGSSISSTDEEDIVTVTPVRNRRSTMEFQTKSQMNSIKKLKIDKHKRPSIVCTKLHKEEIQVFNQIVKKLKGFDIEDEVSSKTTHLVAGELKRTINMLRAVARGCWILKHEWLLRSLEEGKWLSEEDYEATNFSPAVQQCRLQRQAFGPTFTMDVFRDCGSIYIAKQTIPRCSDLKELVSLCKGSVVAISRNAAIVVGEYIQCEGVKCVHEAWVLDSITFNRKMPFKKYIIRPGNKSPVV